MTYGDKGISKAKHVMHVLHGDFKANIDYFVGGTQLHVYDIISASHDFSFSVLSRNGQYMYHTVYENGIEKSELCFFVGDVNSNSVFYDEKFAEIYYLILRKFNIDLIHIHHLKNHTLDIVMEAKKLNIPVVISLHDYYLACPVINLINAENKYCGGRANEDQCRSCTAVKLNNNDYIIDKWRKQMKEVFKAADFVIAPSRSVVSVFEECYTFLKGKIQVIPHGSTDYKRESIPQLGERMHVAFLGGMVEHKGSRIAKELILQTVDDNIKWHIFGQIYDDELSSLETSNLIKHGRYAKKDLFRLLEENNINIVCILSICPESYCYTLSEAWQCNIPAIVTNLGAIADRVRSSGGGIIVETDNIVNQVKETLYQLMNTPDRYRDLCETVQNIKNYTATQMAGRYSSIYREIINTKKSNNTDDVDLDSLQYRIDNYINGYKEIKSDNYDLVQPKLSLVICTYMGKQFLEQQIKSILEQTVPPDEIILSDDGSTDGTFEMACKMLQDSRMPFLARKNIFNIGFVKNFENAIMLARGNYITLSDQDDVWLPDRNEVLLKVIKDAEEYHCSTVPILSFCDCLVTDKDLHVYSRSLFKLIKMHPKSIIKNKYALCIQNVVTGMCCMFNAALLKKAMPLPEGMLAHDWWLALTAKFWGRIILVKKPLVYYRQHGANQIGAAEKEPAINWVKRIWNLNAILRENWYWYRLENSKRIYHIRALKEITKDPKLDLIEFGLTNGGIKISFRLFFMGATPADWRRKLYFLMLMHKYHPFYCPDLKELRRI